MKSRIGDYFIFSHHDDFYNYLNASIFLLKFALTQQYHNSVMNRVKDIQVYTNWIINFVLVSISLILKYLLMIIISERKEGVETHRCVWRVGGNGSGGRAVTLLYTPPSSPSCAPPVEQTQSIQSARCVHGTISRLNHNHRHIGSRERIRGSPEPGTHPRLWWKSEGARAGPVSSILLFQVGKSNTVPSGSQL